jgi:signal transduction histidine kinase/ligand-binding sensor domain-containing protein/DNA-binding response OmpR family regulator
MHAVSLNCLASNDDFKIIDLHHLTVENGLSQSTVLAIYQDVFGFIWIGTRDGLNMWDGYKMKVYKNNPLDSMSLKNNYINAISGDENGNIWVATHSGISFFNRKKSGFINNWFSNEYNNEEVRTLLIEDNGIIWAGLKSGLFCLNKSTRKFEYPTQDFIKNAGLWSSSVFSLYYKNNNLWVGSSGTGVFKIDFLNQKTTLINKLPQINMELANYSVESIIEDKNGNIWLGTYGGGVVQMNPQTGEFHRFTNELNNNNSLTDNNIRQLVEDYYGRIWIGTFQGLSVYDPLNEQFVRIIYDEYNGNGLTHNSIRSLFVDNKGSVWIGTYFGGVNIYFEENQFFKRYEHQAGNQNSLAYNIIGAFAQDNNGNLWIGTEGGGLSFFNQKNEQFTHYKADNSSHSLSGNTIKSLYFDKYANNLWIGVFKGGLNLFDISKNIIKRFPDSNNKAHEFMADAIINCITADGMGSIWLATDKYGIQKFSKKTFHFDNFVQSDTINSLLKGTKVRSLMIDKLGNIWISTIGEGIIVFNETTTEIVRLNKDRGLSSDKINHCYEDYKGNIWISTQDGGLNLFDRLNQTVKIFYTSHGLLNNNVLGVMEDNSHKIWISTLNGISVYSDSSVIFKNYDYHSGFHISELNEGAFYKCSNGDFVFGGNNGFLIFNPARIQKTDFVSPTVITEFILFNKSELSSFGNIVYKGENKTNNKITLKHNQSVFTFEFSLLNYNRPESSQYEYKLDGYEFSGGSNRWNYIDNQHSLTFTNLKPGDYIFTVRGRNFEGSWSQEPASVAIEILPPPWKTWWAFFIYSLIIVIILFYFWQNAIKSANMKHALQLKELEKEKLNEIQKKQMELFTNISHEFRSPLTLIINPLEEIIEKYKDDSFIKRQLGALNYNTRRLLLLVNQLLEIREIDTGNLKIVYSDEQIVDVVGCVVSSFNYLADQRNIKLNYLVEKEKFVMDFDRDKIEKIFYNLLSNSFKFTEPGGAINVICELELDQMKKQWMVKFTISDDGQGVTESDLPRIFERFYKFGSKIQGSGIGLSLVKSLVEMHQGTISVSSKKNEGTSFIILLPVKRITGDISNIGELEPLKQLDFLNTLPAEYSIQNFKDSEENYKKNSDLYTVLIVDDDNTLTSYLDENLRISYNLLIASSGEEGLDLVSEYYPDVIVSDIMMPGINGFELCRKVKSKLDSSHIPVILLTSKDAEIGKIEGLESGADAYINKPFLLKELRGTINNLIENRKKLREKYKTEIVLQPNDITITSYDEQFLNKVKQVIEKNIAEPNLSVEFLGKCVGLSKVQIYRKLKALTDLTPAEFIKKFRLNRSAQLLVQQKYRVSEVMQYVGYQDINYFGKCFKKEFGISPTEYSQKNEKSSQ